MTLKELSFFYKLCENPQVTQVASELNISQAQVSRLEKNAIKNVSKLIK